VTMCFIPFQSAAHWLVVTVPRSSYARGTGEKLVARLGEIVFRSRSGSFIPKVILMDDDVDPTDLDELVWAFATRNHPTQGQFLFPDQKVLPLVAFLSAAERNAARGAKVIYNCLSPEDCPPTRPRGEALSGSCGRSRYRKRFSPTGRPTGFRNSD
jgi:UbiD family decarboxylase